MEIKRTITQWIRSCCCVALFMAVMDHHVAAQPPDMIYTVKSGKMYIQLSKELPQTSLDSFINQFDLHLLGLKHFIRTGVADSLWTAGWHVDVNTKNKIIITKPLTSANDWAEPYNKILLSEDAQLKARFPSVSNSVVFGYNRFRNKFSFRTNDSVVTFFLRNHLNTRQVMLAGSFNLWKPDALSMTKTDSGWIAYVKLGPGKYWYKFIQDGDWMVDNDNRISENDGLGNTNSVFYKTNIVFRLNGFTNAKRVYLAGSFNEWNPTNLEMIKTANGWELPMYLAHGTHTYRFVVDGKWYTDPDNKDRLPNEFDDYNSVIRIGKPYLFMLDGFTNASQVLLTGSFNGWRKDELFMVKTSTGWELPYTLGPGNYEYHFIVDGKKVTDVEAVLNNANSYLVLEPNYTFRLKGYQYAKSVFLAGDFNGWSPGTFAMKRDGDEWLFSVHLYPGKHLYKFIVDGKWIRDPGNKLWEENDNSVLWIAK